MVIVEKHAKEAGHSAPRYVRSLTRYMETAKRNSLAEEYGLTLPRYMTADKDAGRKPLDKRVLATGAMVGGQATAWDAALAELNARMIKRSSRSKKPARHLVGSVHADEGIDPDRCNEMAAVLAAELGCEAGVIMWALHGDTDNLHLHFLVLTLDPNGAATPFGRDGRSHEAMQRAIARIEHDQGFAPERGGRYEVRDGKVERLATVPQRAKTRAPIRTEVLQHEAKTGVESFTRYAQEMLAPHLDAATSWDEAQAALAPLGAHVLKVGSGGEIRSGDGLHKVKLSNVDRKLSWSKLIGRWGERSEPRIKPAPYEPRVLDGQRAAHWLDREDQAEPLHDAVQARIDRLKAERKAVVDDIKRDHGQNRADLTGLVREPSDLARLRQGLDVVCGRRITATSDEYGDRIAALRELRSEVDDAENLDHIVLDDVAAFERSIAIDWCDRPAQPAMPPGFTAERVGQSIQYWHDDRTMRGPAFVERGNRIWINDSSDTSLRAALIVAQARYGVVAAHGDSAFVAQVQRLGRELGIDVQNGAINVVPVACPRSPRVQQRRDAVRRWEARASAQDRETVPIAGGRDTPRKTVHQPVQGSAPAPREGKDKVMSQREQHAILARVARLLAENDWDPRDYRRAAAVRGGDERDFVQSVSERPIQERSSPVFSHAQLDRAGTGR